MRQRILTKGRGFLTKGRGFFQTNLKAPSYFFIETFRFTLPIFGTIALATFRFSFFLARFATFPSRCGPIKWRLEGRSQNSPPLCRKLSRARNLTFFSVLVYRTPDFRLGAGLAFLTQKGCHIVRQKSSKSRPLQNPCPCTLQDSRF